MTHNITYRDIRGLPVSTAPGHTGQFVFGYLEAVPVVIMQGRVHCYEGYSSLQAVRPIRVMKMLGAETLILTNSSGGIRTDFRGGEIMMITDHILFGVQNPLIGANIPELGDRFPDMKNTYDAELWALLRNSSRVRHFLRTAERRLGKLSGRRDDGGPREAAYEPREQAVHLRYPCDIILRLARPEHSFFYLYSKKTCVIHPFSAIM